MVPGRASKPLGEITLLVQFGTASNYRVEHINFYIADFNTAYHAILVNTLVPVVSTAHLVVRRLIGITRQARTSSTARTYPKVRVAQ